MTGLPLNPSDGIWDDGEWVSWGWVNGQIARQALQSEYPLANLEVVEVVEQLVASARQYRQHTGRYLQIWGQLGELYAEIKFGLKCFRPGAAGSDGRIANDYVEVKTISPEKTKKSVTVKRSGNFSKLLLVKISSSFEFDAQMIDRKDLPKGTGKHASVPWTAIEGPRSL
jgi:hypothetical protein